MFAIVASRGASGSATADSPNSKPAADAAAAVEIALRRFLREDIFVTGTLHVPRHATPVFRSIVQEVRQRLARHNTEPANVPEN